MSQTKPIDRSEWTDAEVSFALRIADLEEANRRLTAELEDAAEQRDDFLEEIRDLHREYVKEDCPTCNGKGTITEMYPDTSIITHRMSPVEVPVESVCEDCLGTCKVWGV